MVALATPPIRRSPPPVVALASLIGTSIEWYDFYIFGFASALVFPRLFFPMTGQAGVLASFAVFWVAFLARPFGGALFGHFGDRLGRKQMLILALVLMGCGTLAVGLLPTYATIGIFGPLALIALRFLQGIAVGGEWAGAVLMATEHAPVKGRGFFGAFPQMGSPIGAILASGANAVVAARFSENGHLSQTFYQYGWRLPFLASAVLIVIGMIIRLSVTESPAFEHMRTHDVIVKTPVRIAIATQWRTMLLVGGTLFAVNSGYLYGTQIIAYTSGAVSHLNIPASEIILAVGIGNVAYLFAVALGGWLSDRFQRRTIAIAGAALAALASFPIYLLIDSKHFALIVLAECLAYTGNGLLYGPLAALFCEAFPGNVRYSAASLAYHGAAMFGGLAPLIGTSLLRISGGESWVLSLYLLATASISLLSLFLLRDRPNVDLAAPVSVQAKILTQAG